MKSLPPIVQRIAIILAAAIAFVFAHGAVDRYKQRQQEEERKRRINRMLGGEEKARQAQESWDKSGRKP